MVLIATSELRGLLCRTGSQGLDASCNRSRHQNRSPRLTVSSGTGRGTLGATRPIRRDEPPEVLALWVFARSGVGSFPSTLRAENTVSRDIRVWAARPSNDPVSSVDDPLHCRQAMKAADVQIGSGSQ
jgi:hypothetical protein